MFFLQRFLKEEILPLYTPFQAEEISTKGYGGPGPTRDFSITLADYAAICNMISLFGKGLDSL
jgi:hypothetical protein